jgi:CheY-like chemotaxis protein
MNDAPNQPQPQHPGPRKSRRRKRSFGGHSQNNQNQGQQGQGQGQQDGQRGEQRHGRPGGGGGGGQNRSNRQNRGRTQRRQGGGFVGPMDHSYRNQNGQPAQGDRFRNGAAPTANMEPLRQRVDAPTRIFAFVDDLFFLAKIQEVSRKLNVKVEFVKTEKEIAEKTSANANPDEKPSLIVVDLNSNSIKPLTVIAKLRSKYKKPTSIVGFVSHVQGDLKVKAQEAGCDVVMPRSAFSQNLPNILRRHGAEDEPDENFNRV